jgi:regulator of PEP synthase PpsR (kinase-PPPase family)
VLDPVLAAFQSYLGTRSAGRVGAQHALDADYFRRIDALNFSLALTMGSTWKASTKPM